MWKIFKWNVMPCICVLEWPFLLEKIFFSRCCLTWWIYIYFFLIFSTIIHGILFLLIVNYNAWRCVFFNSFILFLFYDECQYGSGNDKCMEYYYIFCEKKISRNVKPSQGHNNSKSHLQFVELQEKTLLFNQFFIGI